ncbi:redoxin domain-containing protein [Labilibaculum sp. K2S]|uniref:peroxiredoxin family protein n=1 Tax=Labilibaculum sp. K2S TaxID=3056386 RepID=UPI0025A3B342|nr:thioredoxin-like domain-containing protein [Labilibaculum sp. K2S]MDM8161826.1 redoxin domain-containing protein [Labilibaculum sp. K2S]
MKKNLMLATLLLACFVVKAQTIDLEFPYFAGKTYVFKIFQGTKQITLRADTIPAGGKVQLSVPKEYAGYKGMAQWYLTNSKTGGGLDFVINNENFSVSCLDSVPGIESIVYKGTAENIFSRTNYEQQEKLFAKHDAMLAATRAYANDDKIYKVCAKEYDRIKEAYVVFVKNLAASPLYAARFREIVNLTRGIGPVLTVNENERALTINDFIVNKLDYEILYTSNHWGGIIYNWIQLQASQNDDAKFVQDTKIILNRLTNNAIYTDFVFELTKGLTRMGKDNVQQELVAEIKNADRLLNYNGVLQIYQQDLSGKAPDIVIEETVEQGVIHTVKLAVDQLESAYSCLVFYESGCGPCEQTMQALEGNYNYLKDNGFKIIAISADTNRQIFINTATQYPSLDKYCDLKGFEGVNFKNYGVNGTPTLYILDSEGIIQTKLATVQQLLDWVKEH